jgi:hypothetical protein
VTGLVADRAAQLLGGVAGDGLGVVRLDAGGEVAAVALAEADLRGAVVVRDVVDAGVGDRGGLAGAVEPAGQQRCVEIADAGVVDPGGLRRS